MGVDLVYPDNRVFETNINPEVGASASLPESHINQPYDISLILPMYNVAPYIKRCLDSVLGQIDIKLQVIIVNDGSTDKSLAITLNYLKEHDAANVIVIDQENKGLSAARNIGISFAIADFVAFLDTDDFMAPNAYSTLYRFATRHDLDLVFCRSFIFDHQDLTFSEFYDADRWEAILKGNQTLVTNSLYEPEILMLEPNTNTKLFKRSYMLEQSLFYPEGLLFEDLPVHVKAILNTSKIGLINERLYNYRINRPGKITEQKSKKRFDMLAIFDQTLQTATSLTVSPEQTASILYMILRMTFWCGTETILNDRATFFTRFITQFKAVPLSWMKAFECRFRNDIRQIRLLWALQKGDHKYLVRLSLGYRQPFKTGLFFIRKGRFAAILFQLYLFLMNQYRRRIKSDF